MDKNERVWWKSTMAWVGGATAILSLVFAVQQLVGWVGGWRGERQKAAELVAMANEQRETEHYPEAWASLEQAAQIRPGDEKIQAAQEDLAMQWLRNARIRVGEQTFTELTQPLLPVLQRGILRAEGARKADLLAHAGWADFLRWRETRSSVSVDAPYKRAIAIDPKNPFANAMLGHWIIFKGGEIADARSHFDAALSTQRERKYVRDMQVAALINRSEPEVREEMLRVANEFRQNNDDMDAKSRRRIFWETCTTEVRQPANWTRPPARISPPDEILTLRWLATGHEAEQNPDDLLKFCEARAHAWSGDKDRSLEMLRWLETNAKGDLIRADAKRMADSVARTL